MNPASATPFALGPLWRSLALASLLVLAGGCQNLTLQGDLREGEQFLRDKQTDRAREAFDRAAQSSKDDPGTLIRIAALYIQAGQTDEAARWLDRAAKADLKPEKRGQVAFLFTMIEQKDRACREWERAVKEEPKNGVIVNDYAYACMVEPGENLDRAIPLLEGAIQSTGRSAAVVDSLGWAYFQRFRQSRDPEDIRKAIELLREAVEKEPGNARLDIDTNAATLRYHLGMAYFASGYLDDAYVELMKATSLDPTLEEAKTALNVVVKQRQRA